MAGEPKRRKLSNGHYEATAGTEKVTTEEGVAAGREQRRSLFVRSLPTSVTTERLTDHFSQSYPLKHATVVLDPATKTSRGFGFVTFADAEDAQAAAKEFNGTKLDGKKIFVEVAESRNREDGADGDRRSKVNTKAVELRAQRAKQREEAQPPRLIVRNLPWSIKEAEDLANLFRSYGKVKHVVLPKRGPRVQSGFGFVVLRGKKNAEKAIAGVNGKEVDGRTLAVDWAVDKKTWEELQEGEAGKEVDEVKITEINESRLNGDDAQNEVTEEDEAPASEDGVDSDHEEKLGEDVNDVEDEDEDENMSGPEPEDDTDPKQSDSTTVFVRNIPFTATDETLSAHFSALGAVRYARIVMDQETDRPRGTGFVAFYEPEIAKTVVKNAPKQETPSSTTNTADKKRRGEMLTHSILQNEAADPTGQYTMDGRILQVTRALNKTDATRRAEISSESRDKRDHDKRRLYLLSEGTVARSSKLYEQLGKAELDIREASAKQRQRLIKTNPNLCLSLTRLSVRNIPRNVDSKELKALAREAVVGFATDVKEGRRQPLNKEEKARGGEEMKLAERRRKERKSGIVTQAKIVFEGREGVKVKEGSAGRSRGYGFIEYVGHRNALMGLRWLNGRSVKGQDGERGKRLIVEFAIENAQVVQRRGEREERVREWKGRANEDDSVASTLPRGKSGRFGKALERKAHDKMRQSGRRDDFNKSTKRKREGVADVPTANGQSKHSAETAGPVNVDEKNKLAKRNRIIAKKRGARQARKK